MNAGLEQIAPFDTAPALLLAINVVLLLGLFWATFYYRSLYRITGADLRNRLDLIENLSEGIYRSSLDGRQLSANRALVNLNGYDDEAEMLEAVKDIAVEWYVEPTRRDQFREILHREGHVEDFVSEIYRHKTRERIWITESARIVRDHQTGRPLYYEGSVREITETVNRLKLEELFRKLTSQLPGGLLQFVRHPDGTYTAPYASTGTRRLAGLSEDEPFPDPSPFRNQVHADDLAGYDNALRRSRHSLEQLDHEFRMVIGGEMRWIRVIAKPEKVGETITWHGYVSDVSVRKKQELEIEKLAFFDPLTDLPNRRLFLERMNEAIAQCRRSRKSGALLFIDLDNFKALNDSKGHQVGDDYLVQVGRRLGECVEGEATVARIGGDEFVVIVGNAGRDKSRATSSAICHANRILAALREPFELGRMRHQASASIGMVVFDGRNDSAEELIKRADVAMYEAKAAGRNRLSVFDPAAMSRESERYDLTMALREAIERDDFRLHLQPQVDRSGRLHAAEALVRWYHPEHGIIKPDRFIPLAESSGLINDLGRMVLEKGMGILADWSRDTSTSELRLALNISVQSFAAPDFVEEFDRLVAREKIDPALLTLEFTEHVMAEDHAQMAARMAALKTMGVRFSLDDFGTGYSSIAYLKELPFDEVKIAGSFVTDILASEDDRMLVRTILAMASTLGLTTVAEKVETQAQEALLQQYGCDIFQGYLYGMPLTPEAFALIAANTRTLPHGQPPRLRA